MVAYKLNCLACKSYHSTRASWNLHLIQPVHQQRAEDLKFFLDDNNGNNGNSESNVNDEVRQCGLLVFASFPVARIEILEAFSCSGIFSSWVTNFVVHPRKPRVGVVIFESREVLETVCARVGPELRICDGLVQVQKCSDFSTLAWTELFSTKSEATSQNYNSASPSLVSSSVEPSSTNKSVSSDNCDYAKGFLKGQFTAIMWQAGMSKEVLKGIQAACELTESLFATNFFHPATVYKYRDCGLRLESVGQGDRTMPYFYLDTRTARKDTIGLQKLLKLKTASNPSDYAAHFETLFGIPQDKLKLMNLFATSYSSDESEPPDESYELTFQANSGPSLVPNATVCVSIGSKYLLEAETDQLYQHLLSFDRNALPLLKLFRYCLQVNSLTLNMVQLKLGMEHAPVIYSYPNRSPSASVLLVVFFLAQMKLIPTTGDLLAPQPLRVVSKKKSTLVIGSTPTFREIWRARNRLPKTDTKASVLQVVALAKDLFSFCAKLASPSESSKEVTILNTKHGEVLTTSPPSSSSPQITKQTKLTQKEVDKVNQALRETTTPPPTPSTILLHPLVVQACFLLSGKECGVLQQISENLSKLISEWRTDSTSHSSGDQLSKNAIKQRTHLMGALNLEAWP